MGVLKTVQAVALFDKENTISHTVAAGEFGQFNGVALSNDARDKAHWIAGSASRSESWHRLRLSLAEFGFEYALFGLIAEPFGQVGNGARVIENDLSPSVKELFELPGVESLGPVPNQLSSRSKHFVTESAQHIQAFSAQFPGQKEEVVQRIMDEQPWQFVNVPSVDQGTGAPYCVTLHLDHSVSARRHQEWQHRIDEIRLWVDACWYSMKVGKHLSRLCRLTRRETESLRLAASGFRVEEAAERMGVSRSSAEKSLSLARNRLGARTTASAIYRANVYGVF